MLTIEEVLIKNPTILEAMGEWLYTKLKDEQVQTSPELTLQNCMDYISDINTNRIYSSWGQQESIIENNLAGGVSERCL